MNKEKSLTHSPVKIAILGGGISGLTYAFYMKQKWGNEVDLTLFEEKNRLGGWIRTEIIGDYLFEYGPRAFRQEDSEAALELINDLNLQNEIISANQNSQKRYLLHQGELQKVPSSLMEFISSPLMKGNWGSIFSELFVKRNGDDDESVFSFFERHFSTRIAEAVADPMVKGIFAGDAKKLSLKGCFPALDAMESKYRSLLLGLLLKPKNKSKNRGLVTLRKGLNTIIDALAKKIDAKVCLSSKISKISFDQKKGYIHEDQKVYVFDYVVSTLPSYALSRLIDAPSFSTLLQQIHFKTVGIAHLGYSKDVLKYPGYGYLVPSKENQQILGVIFDSSVFPEQNLSPNQTRLTVMVENPQEGWLECSKSLVMNHLRISQTPDMMQGFIAKEAIAQYPVGFKLWLNSIHQHLKQMARLSLLGTSFYGVSVNQSIAEAKRCAYDQILKKT